MILPERQECRVFSSSLIPSSSFSISFRPCCLVRRYRHFQQCEMTDCGSQSTCTVLVPGSLPSKAVRFVLREILPRQPSEASEKRWLLLVGSTHVQLLGGLGRPQFMGTVPAKRQTSPRRRQTSCISTYYIL
jgi:hypothetical protein